MTNALRGFASLLGLALSLVALGLLSSCGGGGASTNPDLGGPVQIAPADGTFYAGVPATITISGSHSPYSLTSSEPGILPVPAITNENKVDVVPNNPGVVDTGLQPGQLPVRTVTVTVRGSNATSAVATIKVAQNFLTGYGVSFTSNCPLPTGSTTPPGACAGGTSVVEMLAVFNGSLHGNQQFRLCNIKGDFLFLDIPTNTLMTCVTVTSDHAGKVTAVIVVSSSALSQLAILRVIEVTTGVFADNVFAISGVTTTTLDAIPNSFTFTGIDTNHCGTGSGDFFVFGGVPPFTAASSDLNVTVSPASTNTNPPRFTVTASNPNVCVTNATIIVQDSRGGHTTVSVSTAKGTTTPPPLQVAPTTITLACGTSGSVSVVGGSGSFSATSTHPRVTAVVSGNTVTISRLAGDNPAATFPTTASVSITDGATIQTVGVTITGANATGACP